MFIIDIQSKVPIFEQLKKQKIDVKKNDEEKKLNNIQNKKGTLKKQIDELIEEIEKCQNIGFESTNQIEKINSEIGISNEKILHNKENNERLLSEIEDSKQKIKDLQEEKDTKKQKKDSLFSNKEKFEKITIYDDYYVALWSNTPQRIKIKGDINNDELNNIENSNNINYSNGVSDKDFIENVRFHFTEDGIHTIYNKAPEIIVTSKEILTAYAGDVIDYTKNIQVVDDRDNPTSDHIIDNSKIKVTIVPKETNSGGTQTDSNGSASGSGSSNTEGNGDSDGTDRNPGSESGDTSSSEDIGNQGQTTENEEEALTNGEPSNMSEMLALNIYNTFYGRTGWEGVGQAKAVIFFILVGAIAMIQNRLTRSKEVQQ